MKNEKRQPKTAGLTYEYWYFERGYPYIVGIDEAGRGAWAGPVSAGAVCLPLDNPDLLEHLKGVRDSKEMTPRQRTRQVEQIKSIAIAWGVGSASSLEIDQMGIVPATKQAMQRAVDAMIHDFPGFAPDCLFLDSMTWEEAAVPCRQVNIRGGDKHSLSVAAASVLAKTWRDDHMRELEQQYPGYDFALHKGYGTPKHRAALQAKGASPVHRMYYKPLQALNTSE